MPTSGGFYFVKIRLFIFVNKKKWTTTTRNWLTRINILLYIIYLYIIIIKCNLLTS